MWETVDIMKNNLWQASIIYSKIVIFVFSVVSRNKAPTEVFMPKTILNLFLSLILKNPVNIVTLLSDIKSL